MVGIIIVKQRSSIDTTTYRLMKARKVWYLWARSLGDKSGETDRDADIVAIFRSLIVLVNFFTCFVIMSGVIHHW